MRRVYPKTPRWCNYMFSHYSYADRCACGIAHNKVWNCGGRQWHGASDAINRLTVRRQIISLRFLLTVLHLEAGREHFGARLWELATELGCVSRLLVHFSDVILCANKAEAGYRLCDAMIFSPFVLHPCQFSMKTSETATSSAQRNPVTS